MSLAEYGDSFCPVGNRSLTVAALLCCCVPNIRAATVRERFVTVLREPQ
jgi:hypothetical protein